MSADMDRIEYQANVLKRVTDLLLAVIDQPNHLTLRVQLAEEAYVIATELDRELQNFSLLKGGAA